MSSRSYERILGKLKQARSMLVWAAVFRGTGIVILVAAAVWMAMYL